MSFLQIISLIRVAMKSKDWIAVIKLLLELKQKRDADAGGGLFGAACPGGECPCEGDIQKLSDADSDELALICDELGIAVVGDSAVTDGMVGAVDLSILKGFLATELLRKILTTVIASIEDETFRKIAELLLKLILPED